MEYAFLKAQSSIRPHSNNPFFHLEVRLQAVAHGDKLDEAFTRFKASCSA